MTYLSRFLQIGASIFKKLMVQCFCDSKTNHETKRKGKVIIMNLKSWYYGYNLPDDFSEVEKVSNFTNNSFGLFSGLVGSTFGSPINIVFGDAPKNITAYCHREKSLVFVNSKLFAEDKKERIFPDADLHSVLTVAMGLVVHEAAHFRWTDNDYPTIYKRIGVKIDDVRHAILNVLDDIYIDHQTKVTTPHFAWLTTHLHDFFFTEKEIASRIKEVSAKPKTFAEVAILLEALICAKNLNLDDCPTKAPAIYKHFWSKMRTVINVHDLIDRARLAEEIRNELFDLIEEDVDSSDDDKEDAQKEGEGESESNDDESESNDDESESGESDNDGKGEGENDGENDGSDNASENTDSSKNAQGNPADLSEKLTDDEVNELIALIEELGEGLQQQQMPIELDVSNLKESKPERHNRVTYKVEMDMRTVKGHEIETIFDKYVKDQASWNAEPFKDYSEKLAKNLATDEKYVNFSGLMQRVAETRTFNGPQMNRGRKISQLSRIATDGKIFSNPTTSKGMVAQEIIILLDLSGSMYKNNRVLDTLSAALGTVKGLESGRHKVAVYGHTCDLILKNGSIVDLAIYKFKGFNDTFQTFKKSVINFSKFGETYSLLGANNDDLAVSFCAEQFTNKIADGNKTLIVISDGQPSSNRIGFGRCVLESCRKNVDELRQKFNCRILSISIAKEAQSPNNTIYGIRNNFLNEDPSIVTDIIKRIMKV